ncbi:MAG: hypothetical protein NT116_00890 [Candidatus Parcubacteria bacterium]|nr:hypothetical protein [Candidatus Parcubacteria bacterium]
MDFQENENEKMGTYFKDNCVQRDIYGSNEVVFECLYDKIRTNNFNKAIKDLVFKGARVLDIGVGTGILSYNLHIKKGHTLCIGFGLDFHRKNL